MKTYEFDAEIQAVEGIDGAFVVVPYALPSIFGCGRMKVHASFDGHPYDGSIVSSQLGASGAEKSYILGIRKDIRAAIGKQPGDKVHVSFVCAQIDGSAATYFEMLRAKALRKGRTDDEFLQVIVWLLGYTPEQLSPYALENVSYADWLEAAPVYNPLANKVSGKVCGVAVSEVEDPVMRRMRVLDKLVDELAKGKALEKILRS